MQEAQAFLDELEKTSGEVYEGSPFYCTVSLHLMRLECPTTTRGRTRYHWAFTLYDFALHLSTEIAGKRKFYASLKRIAQHFDCDYTTILDAAKILEDFGFFRIHSKQEGAPTCYEVLTHEQWAKENPGRCASRYEDDLPWNGLGDPLGQHLHMVSGGKVKVMEHYLTGLRSTGLKDDEIVNRFDKYLTAHPPQTPRSWNTALYKFSKTLKGSIQ